MSRPGLLLGGLVGLLLTAPLVVVSALGNQLAGLPFLPFDLFPLVRDLTPGPVLTFVIDTMVNTIRALDLGRVDTAAKTAEQGMAVFMLLGVGIAAGALFFAAMRGADLHRATTAGLAAGLVLGIVMAVIGAQFGLSSSTGSPLLDALWNIILFVVWGALLGWAYARLSQTEPAPDTRLNMA